MTALKIKIDQEANDKNIKVFEQYSTYNPWERRHICVSCGAKTSIDESFSCRGERLICRRCLSKTFKRNDKAVDYIKAFSWIENGVIQEDKND